MRLSPFVDRWLGVSIPEPGPSWREVLSALEPLGELNDGENKVRMDLQAGEMEDFGPVRVLGSEYWGGVWGLLDTDLEQPDPHVCFEDSCLAGAVLFPFSIWIRIMLVRSALHRIGVDPRAQDDPGLPVLEHPLRNTQASRDNFGVHYASDTLVAQVYQGQVWLAQLVDHDE